MSLEAALKELIAEEFANFDISDKVSECVDDIDLTDKVETLVNDIDLSDTVEKIVDNLDIDEKVQNCVNDMDLSDVVSEELGKLDLSNELDGTITDKIDNCFEEFVRYDKSFERKLDDAIENYCQTDSFESRLKELIIEAWTEIPYAELVPTPQEIQADNARMFEELAFEEAEAERKKSWLDNEKDLNAAWQDAAM